MGSPLNPQGAGSPLERGANNGASDSADRLRAEGALDRHVIKAVFQTQQPGAQSEAERLFPAISSVRDRDKSYTEAEERINKVLKSEKEQPGIIGRRGEQWRGKLEKIYQDHISLFYDNKTERFIDPDRVASLSSSLIDLQKKMYGENSQPVAHSLNILGKTHYEKGDFTKARETFEKSNGILSKLTDDDSYLGVIQNTNNIADTFIKEGKYSAAENCYIKALDICKENSPQTDRSTCEAMLATYRSYISMIESLEKPQALKELKTPDAKKIRTDALKVKRIFEDNEERMRQQRAQLVI